MISSEMLGYAVSRETSERLTLYLALLEKWNPRINLVARSTIKDAVQRHFIDSAQLSALDKAQSGPWVDLGSGGGFPGLVVAILKTELAPDRRVTLIESDTRKATFLRTVIRQTDLTTRVLSERIEKASPQNAVTVSARALAPLTKLLDFAARHLSPQGSALLMKGENWGKEVEDARAQWQFSCTPHTSKTNPNAVVLEIGDLVHV
ncbi:16S rRNA (guanine(527)-N(7))-methyltransferase RsmG [Antarctobacter heliothermus]|uniref:Ribosomal RNA small subunit methyltransferase G n=1 Tax=Antarctobacter heliothermus TaxID=74033 RepID=A0A239BTD2_9RHOB|nr:16S rRNA (guanine(527)-N(7))-methyltransferase RsmG [Antarctobacter heliothermus]SNS10423.1 16S rRNA m(7)G-527 methyltransferase [Antarctobacter heliothermus]